MNEIKEVKSEIRLPKENMTEEEFEKWRESLDPDSMGFNGVEGGVIIDG